MTRRKWFRLFGVTVMLLGILGLSSPSWAIGLQDAKAQGLLGEQADGYLGLVKPNAPADVKALMNHINAQRKQAYQSIAQKNQTKLQVVEALAGKKAIERTPKGQYIRSPSGGWQKK